LTHTVEVDDIKAIAEIIGKLKFGLLILQVTVYHMLKLFQTEADIMLGKKNLVSEFYDELVCDI